MSKINFDKFDIMFFFFFSLFYFLFSIYAYISGYDLILRILYLCRLKKREVTIYTYNLYHNTRGIILYRLYAILPIGYALSLIKLLYSTMETAWTLLLSTIFTRLQYEYSGYTNICYGFYITTCIQNIRIINDRDSLI